MCVCVVAKHTHVFMGGYIPGGIGVSKAGYTKEHTWEGKWRVIHMLSIGLRQFHMCLRLPRSTQKDSVRFLLFYMRISLFPSSS